LAVKQQRRNEVARIDVPSDLGNVTITGPVDSGSFDVPIKPGSGTNFDGGSDEWGCLGGIILLLIIAAWLIGMIIGILSICVSIFCSIGSYDDLKNKKGFALGIIVVLVISFIISIPFSIHEWGTALPVWIVITGVTLLFYCTGKIPELISSIESKLSKTSPPQQPSEDMTSSSSRDVSSGADMQECHCPKDGPDENTFEI